MDGQEFEYEYPLPDDEVEVTAPTQQEADESRAAWENDQDPEAHKTHVREEIGMDLAWWRDDSFAQGFSVVLKVVDSCVDTVETVKSMRDHGLPDNILSSSVELNMLTGTVVMSALQVLGVIEPLLREDIYALLKIVADAMPEATEEETAFIQAASEKAVEARFAAFAQDMAARGAVVFTPEDLADRLETQQATEDGLGDPSNN